MLSTTLVTLALCLAPDLHNDPTWGTSGIGATHGGVTVLSDGRILVNTDTDKGTLIFNADGTTAGSIATQYPAIHGMQVRTEP